MTNIKNYTSQVPAYQSIQSIESMLIEAGATRIMKDYAGGKAISISFMLMEGAMPIPIKLPAKVDEVKKLLKGSSRVTPKNLDAQAERTSWKLIHDWVQIQISMYKLRQVELLEIFLPYMYDFNKKETFIQKVRSSGMLQLNAASEQ